jgi:hypothetical protein
MQNPSWDPSQFGDPADTAHLPRDRAAFLAYCRFFTDSSVLRDTMPTDRTGQQVLYVMQARSLTSLHSIEHTSLTAFDLDELCLGEYYAALKLTVCGGCTPQSHCHSDALWSTYGLPFVESSKKALKSAPYM